MSEKNMSKENLELSFLRQRVTDLEATAAQQAERLQQAADYNRLMAIRLSLIDYAASHTLDELLTRALDEVATLVDSPIGFYHFLDSHQKSFIMQQWSTRTLKEFCRAEGTGAHYDLDQAGVWADCIRERKPVIHNDVAALPNRRGMPAGHAQVIRELVVPVFREGKIRAVLGVGNKPVDYSQTDVALVSFLADVTWHIVQNKQAEEKTLAEKTFTDRALDHLLDIFFLFDPETGRAQRWNRTFQRITGYSDAEIAVMPVPEGFISVGDMVRAEIFLPQVLRDGSGSIELTLVCKDGQVIPTEFYVSVIDGDQDKPGSLIVIGRDMTERLQAEQLLARERSLLRTLVDHLPVAVYVKDIDCRKILSNPADIQNTGAASETEVLGKTDFDVFPPDLAEKFYADDQRVIRSGQPMLNREEEITLPDGSRGWQLTSKMPVYDSAGQVMGLVGIGNDITARVRTDRILKAYAERLEEMVMARTRELKEAQDQLIRKERLATLGQLAGGVGHELRNPLGAIKNATYFLNMVLPDPDAEVQEILGILRTEVDTADRIITDLLDFARAKVPVRSEIRLNDVIRHTMSRVPLPEAPVIEVDLQLGDNLPVIRADPEQLHQIFSNIIQNAVQAMPDGGKMVIKTALDSQQWVAVSITDTGSGIPAENLQKIFEPLFTTKSNGIGLGLALVKNLVAGHGGRILVESKVGEGSTFTVKLPFDALVLDKET